MDLSYRERLEASLGRRLFSRRGALGRLGRAGAASLAAGAALASAPAAAQETSGTRCETGCDGRAEGDAGAAPVDPEELVAPPASLEALDAAEASPAGALRRLTDYDRSLWLNSGTGWSSLGHHIFDVRRFGAVGDGVADDWAAFAAAVESMTSPLSADASTTYGRTLLVPPGRYRLGQSLVLTRSVRLLGAVGSGRVGDAILAPDPGVIGVVVEASEPHVRADRRGEGALVERLRIEAGSPTTANNATGDGNDGAVAAHGVVLRARAALRDCAVVGFPGDGIHIEAVAGAVGSFEADGWEIGGCRVEACGGDGLRVQGGNAGTCSLLLAVGNGGWGVLDDSARGNTYLQCRAAGNGQGAFGTGGRTNRSLFIGCASDPGQPRSVFTTDTVVVAGDHAAGYEGGNAWVADESRMLLRAQAPAGEETTIATAPTLHLVAATGQEQPHLRIEGRDGNRLAEVDAAGRLLVGPGDADPAVGDGSALPPVQVQIGHEENGRAALRWVVGDEATWIATARAFLDPAGEGGDGLPATTAPRLTFQTPDNARRELDTLTLRQGRVGIGTTAPSPAALLDLASATAGFLPPRMTTEQRDAIPSPPEGLTVYNLTTRRLNLHDGDAWRELALAQMEE